MAPQPCRPGTIFFQEDVIRVQPSTREHGLRKEEGVVSLKLPVLRSPRQPSASSRSAEPLSCAQVTKTAPVKLPIIIVPTVSAADAGAGPPPLSAPTSPVRASVAAEICAREAEVLQVQPRPPAKPRRRRKQLRRAEKHSDVTVVGNKTLAEVVRAKELAGGAVCRYDCVEQELHKELARKSQLATHRRDVARQAGVAARARARKRAPRRKKPVQQQQIPVVPHDLESCMSLDADSAGVNSSRSPSPHSPRAASVESDPAHKADREYKDRVLRKLKLKHSKLARMNNLTKARKDHLAECGEAQRGEMRQLEFEMLPIKEQDALRAAYFLAFQSIPEGGSGSERRNALFKLDRHHPAANAVVDCARQLYDCLTLLGLAGETDVQQKEIGYICSEATANGDLDFLRFCVELVPRVRRKLIELHQEALSEQFAYYDQDRNGHLDCAECYDMVKKLCRCMDSAGCAEVETEFRELFDELSMDGELGQCVDFDGFQMLIERVREKCECVRRQRECDIMHERNLTQDVVVDYGDELLLLHETFVAQDVDQNGGLDDVEVVGALLEHGLVPKESDKRAHVEWLVMQAAREDIGGDGLITFASFLELVHQVREDCQSFEATKLREYFDECDKDRNGMLSFAEASVMFEKLGLVPQCRDDQDEMKDVLFKVDEDDSADIDFPEFQRLIQNITEKLRMNQRHRENEICKQLGYAPHQVAELREIFFNLDPHSHGDIGIAECRKVVTMLRMDLPSAKLNALFESAVKAGNEKKSKTTGRIDLECFFYFMKAIDDLQTPQKAPESPKQAANRLAALWEN